MKCVLLLTVFFAIVAYVQAGIKIVQPIGSTTWALGNKYTVKWEKDTNKDNKSPESGSHPISILYYAPGAQQTAVNTIVYKGQVPDVAANSFTLDLSTVDKSKFPATGKYSICIGETGSDAGSYSAQFSITGGTGTVPSGTGAGSAAPVGGVTTGLGGAAKTPGLAATTTLAARTTATKTIAQTATNLKTNDAKTVSAGMTIMAIVAAFVAVFM